MASGMASMERLGGRLEPDEAWLGLQTYAPAVLVGPWQAARHLERARREQFRRDYEQAGTDWT